MISRLRRRHRRMVAWVAGAAAIGFVAALAARPTRPIEPSPPGPSTTAWTELGEDGQLRAALQGAPGDEWILIERGPSLAAPDLLVSLSGEEGGADEALLGALGDPGIHRYRLPTSRQGGILAISSRGAEDSLVALRIDELARVP